MPRAEEIVNELTEPLAHLDLTAEADRARLLSAARFRRIPVAPDDQPTQRTFMIIALDETEPVRPGEPI
ncbi:hypothetical protein AB0J63_13840 [Streptosporangium canum]|uniref:hypothetical protein n=1 Tax=Streptosporangium canum TaxID=324952 RepID=UPI00342255CF